MIGVSNRGLRHFSFDNENRLTDSLQESHTQNIESSNAMARILVPVSVWRKNRVLRIYEENQNAVDGKRKQTNMVRKDKTMTEKQDKYGTDPWIPFSYQPLMKVGEYQAELTSVDRDEGQFGPQLQWTFEIADGEYKGVELTAWSSAVKFSEKTKSYKWASALGHPKGADFHPRHILGKHCLVTVTRETRESDNSEFNKIPENGVRPLENKGIFGR